MQTANRQRNTEKKNKTTKNALNATHSWE